MSYLIAPEFKRFIQVDNLNQVINNDPTILLNAILDAQAIARQNLVQKYMINEEMTDTLVYDPTLTTYVPGARVYLDATLYDATKTFALKALSLYQGNIYVCSVAIVAPEAFTLAHWTLLGKQYAMFYVPYPLPIFNYKNTYKAGDQVFWNGQTYTCILPTVYIDHTTLIQNNSYADVPLNNIFPDDPIYGEQYWGIGTPVTVATNLLPNSPWVAGDNRDRSLVRHLSFIVLYIIFPRISPRNIPTLIETHYTEAMRWLHDARDGNITTDIATIQPRTGGRIRWGSKPKNINSY